MQNQEIQMDNSIVFQNGMESLRIPPIDPYVVESQSMTVRRGDTFSASGTVRKVNIYGASKAKILEVK